MRYIFISLIAANAIILLVILFYNQLETEQQTEISSRPDLLGEAETIKQVGEGKSNKNIDTNSQLAVVDSLVDKTSMLSAPENWDAAADPQITRPKKVVWRCIELTSDEQNKLTDLLQEQSLTAQLVSSKEKHLKAQQLYLPIKNSSGGQKLIKQLKAESIVSDAYLSVIDKRAVVVLGYFKQARGIVYLQNKLKQAGFPKAKIDPIYTEKNQYSAQVSVLDSQYSALLNSTSDTVIHLQVKNNKKVCD